MTDQSPERCIASDRVEGTVVYNPRGEKLGTIKHFMVEKKSGEAQYAIMEFGGLFGIGSDHYPIPWDMLDYDEKQEGYVVDIDESKLGDAPRYRDEAPAWTDVYAKSINSYYGIAYPYM